MNSFDHSTVFGLNPVFEALKARKRRCYKLIIEQGKTQTRLNSLIELARENKVPIETIPKTDFQKNTAVITIKEWSGFLQSSKLWSWMN